MTGFVLAQGGHQPGCEFATEVYRGDLPANRPNNGMHIAPWLNYGNIEDLRQRAEDGMLVPFKSLWQLIKLNSQWGHLPSMG